MTNQPLMPSPPLDPRPLSNLRRARLEFEELGLQLEEAIASTCLRFLMRRKYEN